jgi:hypothetical protein
MIEGTQRGPGPSRIVLDASGSREPRASFAKYAESRAVPHITLDPTRRRAYQHISLDLAAPAIKGGSRPHAEGYVVWVALAKNLHDSLTPEESFWVGEQVRAISAACFGKPLEAALEPYSTIDEKSPYRGMGQGEWMDFSGVCGTCHLPAVQMIGPGPMDFNAFLEGYGAQPEIEEGGGALEVEDVLEEEALDEPVIEDEPAEEGWTDRGGTFHPGPRFEDEPTEEPAEEEPAEEFLAEGQEVYGLGPFPGRKVSLGSGGKAVTILREVFDLPPGKFDKDLEDLVRALQAYLEIEATGIVDRETWDKFSDYMEESNE